jgi:ribonuclease-3
LIEARATEATRPADGAGPRASDEGLEVRLQNAEALFGHSFSRRPLLREALTHRSAASGRKPGRGRRRKRQPGTSSNERLEFIGDRVLGLVMAEWLAERFPAEQEGELGPRLAHLVSREAVCMVAERVGLAAVLALGANEAKEGVGRLATVLADALEAALGALYLDGGLEAAKKFIRTAWEPMMQAQILPPKDPKTALQEVVLSRGDKLPDYRCVSSQGPSHAPLFVVQVSARDKTGTGQGTTKRMAERLAAADLLAKLA